MVVMSPAVATKSHKQKEVIWQQYRLCLAVAEHQIQNQKTLPCFRTRIRKNLVVEGVPTEWQVRATLGDCSSKAMVTVHAPHHRQHALISDFLDPANLSTQEEAALATNWINDRPEGLKLQNLALATMAGPVMSSLPKNLTADVHYAVNKCESLDPGQQLIPHGNPSAIAAKISPHMAVRRCHVLPNLHLQCCMLLQGTFGGDFDIFATSGESTAWVLLWKTRSRPIGVRVCPVAQFDFFSTAFDPREWTMVVFLEGRFVTSAPTCYT